MNVHTLIINKSNSNERNTRNEQINSPQSLMNTWIPTYEITSQAKIFESMPKNGMKGAIWLPSMHQNVKNDHSKWSKDEMKHPTIKAKNGMKKWITMKYNETRWYEDDNKGEEGRTINLRAQETFLPKHTYTSKGLYLDVENISKAIRKKML